MKEATASPKDDALKLALEALTNAIAVRNGEGGTKLVSPLEENAITAIKEALAQDEKGLFIDLIAQHDGLAEEMAQDEQSSSQEPVLQNIEQYRLQMAGISTAALGYWKEGDGIHPDYDTVALRDVAKLYAKYDALYKAQPEQEPVHSVQSNGRHSPLLTHMMNKRTTPPKEQRSCDKRPWVGLTDEQREACTQSPFTEDNYEDIEDKLKELNT